MGKLFNLKEWVTVPDAAKHLSILLGEEVSEADVLHLVIDGRLKLSVKFVNYAQARCGMPVPIDDAPVREFRPEWAKHIPGLPDEFKGKPVMMVDGVNLDDKRILKLEDDVQTLQGVWDLLMLGGEALDVEQRYQMLTGGPEVTLYCFEGAFVERTDGTVCQLQDRFPESINARPGSDSYFPAAQLKDDCVFVVRTSALREFERSINGETVQTEKPLSTTERSTLLKMIIAMAIDAYGYVPTASKSPVTKDIVNALAKAGMELDPDTVRKYLKEAANTVLPSKPHQR